MMECWDVFRPWDWNDGMLECFQVLGLECWNVGGLQDLGWDLGLEYWNFGAGSSVSSLPETGPSWSMFSRRGPAADIFPGPGLRWLKRKTCKNMYKHLNI